MSDEQSNPVHDPEGALAESADTEAPEGLILNADTGQWEYAEGYHVPGYAHGVGPNAFKPRPTSALHHSGISAQPIHDTGEVDPDGTSVWREGIEPTPRELEFAVIFGLDLAKIYDKAALCGCKATKYYIGQEMVGLKPSYLDANGEFHPSEPHYVRKFRTEYVLFHAEEFPKGAPYWLQVQRTADILVAVCGQIPHSSKIVLIVESNAMGGPVTEQLEKEFALRPELQGRVNLLPIATVAGEKGLDLASRSCSKAAYIWRLHGLMSASQPELLIPQQLSGLAPTLDELRNFHEKQRANEAGRTYEGQHGVHDDLVLALAMSVAFSPGMNKVTYSQRIY